MLRTGVLSKAVGSTWLTVTSLLVVSNKLEIYSY